MKIAGALLHTLVSPLARHRLALWVTALTCLAFALVAASLPAHAQSTGRPIIGAGVQKTATGALGILGISVIPNESASTLFLDSSSGSDYNFQATQFGGAFTVSKDLPLYMEGFIGASRYDPTFIFSGLTQERRIRAKWTSFAATGGIGYDISLTDNLILRPIGNFSLGTVISDASIAQFIINDILRTNIKFIDNGEMFAFGYGGSVMLDYEYKSPKYDLDSELRYSHIRLQTFGGSSNAVNGLADAITLGMWNRVRIPTGYNAFGGPIRGVGELAGSLLLGDQYVALKSTWLLQLGMGVEFDMANVNWFPLSRVRITARAINGERLYGTSIGLGATF